GADLARGRALVESSGCGTCHAFTGVPPLPTQPSAKADPPEVVALAPDLRFVRDRLEPASVLVWLREPEAIRRGALMPRTALSETEARDVAAYLLRAPLAPVEQRDPPPRLPLLERRVTYDEVNKRVFGKTCRHCHADADFGSGDGGPGNTGGFGSDGR